MAEVQRPARAKAIATAVAVLAALAILISLGTWQLERLHWKQGLLAQIEERRKAAPVPLVDVERAVAAGEDVEYRRVSVTGTFDHARERHFFATFEGRSGFYIYTPLRLESGQLLFVNRGFVPYDMKEGATRQAGQVTGEVTLTGYARDRLAEKPSWLVPDNDVAKNIFYWKDMDAMISSAKLDPASVLPFFVDADETVKSPGGLPRGGVTQFDLPNNHLQYALTWYGLALALVAVVIGMRFRKGTPQETGKT